MTAPSVVRLVELPVCDFCHAETAYARVTVDGYSELNVCDTCLDKADTRDRDEDAEDSWPS